MDQLWAEAVARFNAGEELILRDELQKAALAEQQAHTERDPWDGDILEFLEKPVPLDWAKRTVDERVAWWENGPAEGTATQQRTTVCVNEIWREALDSTGKAPDRMQSKRIAAVLNSSPNWQPAKYPQRHGPYGCSGSGAENQSNYPAKNVHTKPAETRRRAYKAPAARSAKMHTRTYRKS